MSDTALTAGSDNAAARARAVAFLETRHRPQWIELLPWLLAAVVYFAFPDRLAFGSQVLIWVMFALSLDLILGYAGIVTLGHAAFFGIGAYTVALMSTRLHWGEPITLLFCAAAMSALVGFATGWVLLRYRGLALLVLTLSVTILMQQWGNLFSNFTGGYDGIPGIEIWPLLGLFDYDLYGHTNYLYCLAALFVMFLIVRQIIYSPFGQALAGIRENVQRMNAIGSPVHWRLVVVYTIGAAIAGVAGALFAETNAYVTLGVLDFENSAGVMVLLIVGGTGRLYGAFIGAVVYMVLQDKLAKMSPVFWQFGIGFLLVMTVLFARRGLLGLIEDFGSFVRRRTRS